MDKDPPPPENPHDLGIRAHAQPVHYQSQRPHGWDNDRFGLQTEAGGDVFVHQDPQPPQVDALTPSILSPVHINVFTKIGHLLGIAISVVKFFWGFSLLAT